MVEVFSPKWIYPDCPIKSNQRQVKNWILTPRCAVCFCGVMHMEEIISAGGSNQGICFKMLSPLLPGMLPTAEIVSAVCISPRSQGLQILREKKLRGAHPNARDNLHLHLFVFKEKIRRNPFSGEHAYHER